VPFRMRQAGAQGLQLGATPGHQAEDGATRA
jgi:hypothetical protein